MGSPLLWQSPAMFQLDMHALSLFGGAIILRRNIGVGDRGGWSI
jgi:hypothetical protein